jgi:hypothetical protein
MGSFSAQNVLAELRSGNEKALTRGNGRRRKTGGWRDLNMFSECSEN